MKKIIGLSCGTANGFSETLLKAAAVGAAELGIDTEIIRAMSLKVLPCKGCNTCTITHRCVLKDDVDWILRKICEEDCGLIVSAPCYGIRVNALFSCIGERSRYVVYGNLDNLNKTRVGAIIGVGGAGQDALASLTIPMISIFMQHTRVLVDQIQVNFCGLQEWNLWEQEKTLNAEHVHELRVQDSDYEDLVKRWPQKQDLATFFRDALARSKKLGRNMAKAMSLPIKEVRYVGEDYGVACPVCHNNIMVVPKDLPYVACPVCYVRGKISFENNKMKVQWVENDARNPRSSRRAFEHHMMWFGKHYGPDFTKMDQLKKISKEYESFGKMISPGNGAD
jgi:multimeric flavodoxin WrbA